MTVDAGEPRRLKNSPSGILRKNDLIQRLAKLDEVKASNSTELLEKLHALAESAEYWANEMGRTGLLRRLAKLLRRAGDDAAAIRLLQSAASIAPEDVQTWLGLCQMLVEASRCWEALQAICPLVPLKNVDTEVLISAAKLYGMAGDWERSLQLLESAARRDDQYSRDFLEALTRWDCKERGIREADRILSAQPNDPVLWFACFAAYLKLGTDVEAINKVRQLLFERAPDWHARALRLEKPLPAQRSHTLPLRTPVRDVTTRSSEPPVAAFLGQIELVERVTRLEEHPPDAAARWAELTELEPSARYRANITGRTGVLRRMATLMQQAGRCDAAIRLLQFAQSINPANQRTLVLLSNLYGAEGEWWEALMAICSISCSPDAESSTLIVAAKLYKRAGDCERSLQFYERAARKDPGRITEYLEALVKSERKEQGIAEADRILKSRSEDPELCFACYATYLKLGADNCKVKSARSLLFERVDKLPSGALWRARVFKLEGGADGALSELRSIPDSVSNDYDIIRERATLALAAGYWGRDAQQLLAGSLLAAPASLLEGIGRADGLLRRCGTSLEAAAKSPFMFSHIKSPESAFDAIIADSPHSMDERGTGLVMVTASLGGGGAERMVARSVNCFGKDSRFAWIKLYARDVSRATGADFYLRKTGGLRSDITVLKYDRALEPPWSWLGSGLGRRAQSIFDLLKSDRPGIVHASLDFMNIPTGLAALAAGVPRIILHVHNMRPAQLAAIDADTLRNCYRSLLLRPEVSLVGCAHACLKDYADWLGFHDSSRMHTVHNGMEVQRIISSTTRDIRDAQRSARAIGPDTLVIGTAFRFVELKRPFLWVEAAAMVLSRKPDCKFVMLGDGELLDPVREYIGGKGLSDHFTLPGQVRDVYEWLSIMDLFVLSSRTEALPNTLLEAQAAGVPVIAFDIGGISETMLDGITGWLVREETAEAIGERVLAALTASAWRVDASSAARDFIKRNFNNRQMVEALAAVLLGAKGVR